MPKVRPHPLKHREFIKKLRSFGVNEIKMLGKGSERMLIKGTHHSDYKGPQMPIKCHGEGTEHSVRVINATLRRFNIAAKEFWS